MSTDPKTMAKRLRADLAERQIEVTHGQALETVAHMHGHRDWNTMSAAAGGDDGELPNGRGAVPIFRMFDVERTVAFYVGFLGFRVMWEHRFADHAPLYLEVERDGVRLHLSEHHGDATPGSAVIIEVADAAALQRELIARDYPYARPGLEHEDWGLTVTVGDPASNRITFLQRIAPQIGQPPEAAAGPIVETVEVRADPVDAYEAFVHGFGTWWDPRLSPDAGTFRGVRIGGVGEPVELIHEGFTFPIGTVTTTEPGVRYAQTFTLALDPDHPTTLTAKFRAQREGWTEVAISHGGWTAENLAERGRFTEWPNLARRYGDYVAGLADRDRHPEATPER